MSGHDPMPPAVPSGTAAPPTAAAIDIGSNSIKMTVGRLGADGALEEIAWRSEVVRLGAGIDQTGRLADDRVDAALRALTEFEREARDMGAARVVAVATEAARVAANGPCFLERVRQETGIDVAVIAGEQEATLSFRGLGLTTDLSGVVLVADIGGGSTELILARDGELIGSGSEPVGSGRLTDRFVAADPPTTQELDRCRAEAQAVLRPLEMRLRASSRGAPRLVVVGGTGEYLGRLAPNATRLSSKDVAAVLDHLERVPAAALAEELHIPQARARVLPAGIAVVAALVDLAAPSAITVAQSGIRAGLLLETFASLSEAVSGSARS